MPSQIIECIPNFSEGRNPEIIRKITAAIESIEGVKLLGTDPGKATNRTVVTFVGDPESVVKAAFEGIKMASELIDMSQHTGEHPRMGATDVCPFVPVAGIDMEETVEWAKKLAERVGKELGIPVFLYEAAASKPERRNLASIRAGEYEGLAKKLSDPNWNPDFGPSAFSEKVARTGATVIGARDFLVAYNVNLNTTSVRRANSVAFDIREKGRIKREGDSVTGKVMMDEKGEPIREAGACKAVKAIGWFIEEYGIAQISMNLTNLQVTPLHIAFDETCKSADSRGLRVTGSELVGLVPLKVMTDAGKYFLEKQRRSAGVSEKELIRIAIKSLGLDELGPFDPNMRIIEYQMRSQDSNRLINLSLQDFADETASESVAPGGGSVSAYVGALGISLGTMAANLAAHRRVWDDRWEEFSIWAEKGQVIKDKLLKLVDEDTRAFNGILEAFRLPKTSEEEKAIRHKAVQLATKNAIEVPFQVMNVAFSALDVIAEMAEKGNPSSVSDAGVGALCAVAGIKGAFLNVRINASDLEDQDYVQEVLSKGEQILKSAEKMEKQILEMVWEKSA